MNGDYKPEDTNSDNRNENSDLPNDYGNETQSSYQDWSQNTSWQQDQNYGNGSTKPPRKPKKSKGALIALLIVVCLLGGVAAGTFLVAPGVEKLAQALPGGLVPLPGDENSEQTAQPTPHAEVDIGGTAPKIDAAAESPIVQIAKEVGPAVVGVTVSVEQPVLGQQDTQKQATGYGTGIIISQDGYIVTNNHVISGGDSIKVTLFDGKEYDATVKGMDATTDLAVLKIEATGLTPAALGNSDELQVGESVVAIGNPLGATLAGSVTSGIVSALNREITTNGFSQTYIQTDAAINPGNSGGALVNMKGQVIGINTLKSHLAGYDDFGMPIGTEGIGFAIPISSARPIIEQLIATGSIQRPGIGITCFVDNASATPEGVTVMEVVAGGPADTAGLRPRDVITAIGDKSMKTVDELTGEIQSRNVGDQLDLTVWRNGQEYKAIVVVGDLNNLN